jgi:23S rRNA pseudouridine1911/1915/1917 synthase
MIPQGPPNSSSQKNERHPLKCPRPPNRKSAAFASNDHNAGVSDRAFRMQLFPLIHEDSDMLVLHKPAGLVCHPTKGDEFSSLISRVRLYLGIRSTPHMINRLDRETSGVMMIAKNLEAARELRRIWETRAVRKEYLAIVHGLIAGTCGVIDEPLGPDESSMVAIKDRVRADGAAAQTEFVLERHLLRAGCSLLKVLPRTGRKHQIRIHLAHTGHPLVGDKLYGGDEHLYLAFVKRHLTDEQRSRLILPHHALHARSVALTWRGVHHLFSSEPEEWFLRFLRDETAPEAWPENSL